MGNCFLFPGQGAQYPGMGRDLWENSPKVKDVFKYASDSTGMDVEKLLFEGTEEELKSTDKTQIAITTVSLGASALLNEKGITCQAAAGFSLGEYSALTIAGVIQMKDVFPLVKARGECMERNAKKLDTGSGAPGMAAVMGMDYSAVRDALEGIEGIYIANYNSPSQIVLSGTSEGLNAAEAPLKEAGAKRVIRLKVSAPFHSPLLREAQEEFAEVLAKVPFSNPEIPIYSNVTAKKIKTGEEAKGLCIKQITSTVMWVEEEKELTADGFSRFLEVGPGKVLTGLYKAFGGNGTCQPAGTFENIQEL